MKWAGKDSMPLMANAFLVDPKHGFLIKSADDKPEPYFLRKTYLADTVQIWLSIPSFSLVNSKH